MPDRKSAAGENISIIMEICLTISAIMEICDTMRIGREVVFP